MFHTPFESLSASLRPLGGSAVDSLRTPIDTNLDSLHSLRGVDVTNPFMNGVSATWHGNAIDVGRPLPVPVSLQAPTMDAGGHDFGGSPSMEAEISFLNGINSDGTVTATSYWTWKRDNPATFANQSSVAKWGADHVTTDEVVTINYMFATNSGWDATEQSVFNSCMALWSAVTNVQFNEVTDSSEAELVFKRNNSGSAFSSTKIDSGDGAGEIGGDILSVKTGNLISIDTSVPGFGPIDGDFTAFGGYVWGTIIHELGHSLGLGHAGPYNGFVNPNTQQFSAFDTLLWSIMSYIGPDENAKYDDEYPIQANWGISPDGFGNTATTWMPLDIIAVQGLYGAPISTPLNGGQTFGFNCDVGGDLQNFFDFTVNVNPVVTIWSAGTDNTLDLSGFKKDADVNLNPGTFSSADGAVGNIAIAFGTVIETAIGGRGNDTFIGTDLANTLIGNKGNDTFQGGLGGDTQSGGKGGDTFKMGGASDSTGTGFDTVIKFDFDAQDRFDVAGTITGIDSAVSSGALSEGSFNSDLAAAIGAGQLGSGHAVVFTASSGDFAGDVFIIIDRNGTAGYQANSDYVVMLDHAQNAGDIDIADFI